MLIFRKTAYLSSNISNLFKVEFLWQLSQLVNLVVSTQRVAKPSKTFEIKKGHDISLHIVVLFWERKHEKWHSHPCIKWKKYWEDNGKFWTPPCIERKCFWTCCFFRSPGNFWKVKQKKFCDTLHLSLLSATLASMLLSCVDYRHTLKYTNLDKLVLLLAFHCWKCSACFYCSAKDPEALFNIFDNFGNLIA